MNRGIDFGNETFLAAFLIGLLIGLAIATVIAIFFLLTMQNALKQCAPHNQRMQPSQVWLGLIPIFSYFWMFKIIAGVADSLAAEYRQRGIPLTEERPGYQVGNSYAILTLCGLVQYTGIPVIGQLCGLAGFICWIVYWVRIAKYKRTLVEHQFQFGQGNPNLYQFPNQFPGQPNHYGQQNPYMNQQQQNPYMNQQQNNPNQQPPQQ